MCGYNINEIKDIVDETTCLDERYHNEIGGCVDVQVKIVKYAGESPLPKCSVSKLYPQDEIARRANVVFCLR